MHAECGHTHPGGHLSLFCLGFVSQGSGPSPHTPQPIPGSPADLVVQKPPVVGSPFVGPGLLGMQGTQHVGSRPAYKGTQLPGAGLRYSRDCGGPRVHGQVISG